MAAGDVCRVCVQADHVSQCIRSSDRKEGGCYVTAWRTRDAACSHELQACSAAWQQRQPAQWEWQCKGTDAARKNTSRCLNLSVLTDCFCSDAQFIQECNAATGCEREKGLENTLWMNIYVLLGCFFY